MHTCPFCAGYFHVRALPHQSWWKNYRLCPHCGSRITVDRDTTIRQCRFIPLAMVSLVFTVMLYFESDAWLIPALASYLAMGLELYWGTKHVRFVPYEQDGKQG